MKFIDLEDSDLRKNKYTPEQIEYSIINNFLSLRTLNNTQKLTPYLCAKYIIFGGNEGKYGDSYEDNWLDDNNVLMKQKHITREELSKAHEFVYQEEEREKKELKEMSMYDKNSGSPLINPL